MNEQSSSHHDAHGSGLFDFYVEQLETYLDGELDPGEAADVRARLTEEPAYAAALERLRVARAARVEAFAETEASDDEAAASRLYASARSLAQADAQPVANEAVAGRISLSARWIAGGIAACLFVGFTAGLLGRYDLGTAPDTATSNPVPDMPSNMVLVTGEDGTIDGAAARTPELEAAVFERSDDSASGR